MTYEPIEGSRDLTPEAKNDKGQPAGGTPSVYEAETVQPRIASVKTMHD